MIQKIQINEYLKRIDTMSVSEKQDYLERVGEWLGKKARLLAGKVNDPSAAFQNAIQMSVGWNDSECQAWTEGVRLMTALTGKENTWLPDMLYVKSGARGIKRIVKLLSAVAQEQGTSSQTKTPGTQKPAGGSSASNGRVADIHQNTQETLKHTAEKPKPVRPKHIDQYVHLLPKKTQERAASVRGLLRDLDKARENMSMLAEANAHPDKLATWAKTATSIDNRIKAIYRELDAEWDKLVENGKVEVDIFGNAHINDLADEEKKDRKPGRPPMTDEQKAEKKAEQKAEKNAKRLEYLKKYLRDSRTKDTPERRKQWQKNFKELLKLGGEVTDAIKRAAEVYQIDLETIK